VSDVFDRIERISAAIREMEARAGKLRDPATRDAFYDELQGIENDLWEALPRSNAERMALAFRAGIESHLRRN
jgi:hypothetical protein